MDNHTYFKKLSRIVRWRLAGADADEVLQDYQEMISENADSHADLQKTIGDPLAAVKQLTNPKQYGCWLAVFSLLVICILSAEFILFENRFSNVATVPLSIFLILGLVCSTIYYRLQPSGKTKKDKRMILPLAVEALTIAVTGMILVLLRSGHPKFLQDSGQLCFWVLSGMGTVSAALGILGLLYSRIVTKQWITVYHSGLTALVDAAFILSILSHTDLTCISSAACFTPYLIIWSIWNIFNLLGIRVVLW